MALRHEPTGGPQAIAGLPTYWQDASKAQPSNGKNGKFYFKWHW